MAPVFPTLFLLPRPPVDADADERADPGWWSKRPPGWLGLDPADPVDASDTDDPEEKGGSDRSDGLGDGGLRLKNSPVEDADLDCCVRIGVGCGVPLSDVTTGDSKREPPEPAMPKPPLLMVEEEPASLGARERRGGRAARRRGLNLGASL